MGRWVWACGVGVWCMGVSQSTTCGEGLPACRMGHRKALRAQACVAGRRISTQPCLLRGTPNAAHPMALAGGKESRWLAPFLLCVVCRLAPPCLVLFDRFQVDAANHWRNHPLERSVGLRLPRNGRLRGKGAGLDPSIDRAWATYRRPFRQHALGAQRGRPLRPALEWLAFDRSRQSHGWLRGRLQSARGAGNRSVTAHNPQRITRMAGRRSTTPPHPTPTD